MKLRLRADGLDFWVDVRVACFGSRCIAVADIAGAQELGHGATATAAIASALAVLGPAALSALVEGVADSSA